MSGHGICLADRKQLNKSRQIVIRLNRLEWVVKSLLGIKTLKSARLFVNLRDGWILGQGIYPFLREIEWSRFFGVKNMTETSIYHIYNASLPDGSNEAMGLKNSFRINLLEGLVSEEAELPVAYETKVSVGKNPFSLKLAKILGIIGAVILAVYFVPGIVANLKLSGSEADRLAKAAEAASGRSLPGFDPTLSKTNRLSIPSIGVDTDIEESTYENYEIALKKGVWRVSDFGEPDKSGAPVILAAHRFGYLAWTNSFRHYSSFYNLPKVEVGDVVNVIWEQRQYTYGIYKTEKGEAITDYSADLILYTCETLSGPERIFVYAKLVS